MSDRSSTQTTEIIVTPEMIETGMYAIWDFSSPYPAALKEAVVAAYRAMRALEPQRLVTLAEERARSGLVDVDEEAWVAKMYEGADDGR